VYNYEYSGKKLYRLTQVGWKLSDQEDSNQKEHTLPNQATKRLRRNEGLYFKSSKDACILSNSKALNNMFLQKIHKKNLW
jgi:hypothetical protein